MLINAVDPEESRIAVVENGVLQELHVEIASREAYLGNIYKGKVANIEPSIGAAFVSFGGRTNGFLHASDVLPAYARDDFRLDDVVEGRARVTGTEGPAVVRSVLDDSDDDSADGEAEDAAANGDAPPKSAKKRRTAKAAAAASDESADEEPDSGGGESELEQASPTEADTEAADTDIDAEAADTAEADGEEADTEDADAAGDDAEDDDDEDPDAGRATEVGVRRTRARRRQQPDAEVSADAAGEAEAIGGGTGFAAGLDEAESADQQSAVEAGGDGAAEGPKGGRTRRRGGRKAKAADADETKPARRRSRGGATAVATEAAPKAGRGGRGRSRPKVSTPIDALLKRGQEVVVQVTKEGIGAKGPTLTTYISLPGRSLVLMPSLPKCGVSRKIESLKERRRLKKIVRALDNTGNGGIGFIVRTAGINKSQTDLERDRDYLNKIWGLIAQRLGRTRAPALLYQESDLVLKAMRDLFSPDIEEVVVDSRDVYLRIKDFAEKLMPKMAERIRLHELTTPLFHSFGIETEVQNLYQPRVELPNGVSIVIDQAEALVAIDINSGKFKPGADLEETAYRTNLEAVPEIVRQLRLRDLGGVIIIDFIDMADERHRRGVERAIINALKGDRARIKVGRISAFGMLELTRQRVGPGLKHTVFSTCSHCKGTGLTRTVQSRAVTTLREIRAMLPLKGYSILQVYASPAVDDYLTNYKRRALLDLEEAAGKRIAVKSEPAYPVDMVHYRFLTADGQEARVPVPAGLGVRV